MSVKIWVAWRVPKSRLNELILFVREAVLDGFFKHVEELLAEMLEPDVGDCEPEDRAKRVLERKLFKLRELFEQNWAEAENYVWNVYKYNVTSGLNVWQDSRYAYVIPVGCTMQFLDNKELPDWFEDYHYQTSTDSSLSPAQDRARRKKWQELCLLDWDATRLAHTIIDFSPFDRGVSFGRLLFRFVWQEKKKR